MRERLNAISQNLWWCWNPDAISLFASLDPERWDELHHNPISLLAELPDAVLHRRVDVSRLERVEAALAAYLADRETWCARELPELQKPVAYFSMEFALHESLPIYSGGLGVLAGDHLKSASDLGVPFVAVGLLYREGYFKQVIEHGTQVVAYPVTPLESLPLRKLDIRVEVPHGHHTYLVTAWELKVGRARLLLLDSDVEGNPAEHRALTAQLYGGDVATRIRQEVLLGIGGVRMLRALGLTPQVFHMNEGHCAFVVVERWREEIEAGFRPGEALARAKATCIFTTHTPVAAGHDRFDWTLKNEALAGYRESMGLAQGAIMDLARVHGGEIQEPLNMTVLAIRGARACNAVSALHAEVTRKMWKDLWPQLSVDELPIGHVTNGVHAPSWMRPRVAALLDRCSPGWRDGVTPSLRDVSDEELWQMRTYMRGSLIRHARRETGREWLDPDALTLGFARRFAPYKRGNLLFTDPDRLARLLHNEDRPVQLLYAGKAHPRDAAGQGIIRDVLKWTRDERFRGKVVFLADYDMDVGRRLTQGVDVWLNNPRRPREACGTSGMKVPLNLGINASGLDGWWPEAYDGTNGWAIGTDHDFQKVEEQDAFDAESLYQLLETQIVPEFYDRQDGLPHAWIQRMRRSLETCFRQYHSHRMVAEYARRYYVG